MTEPKEDVVIDDPANYADYLRQTLEQRPADEPAWDALRETLRIRTAHLAVLPGAGAAGDCAA